VRGIDDRCCPALISTENLLDWVTGKCNIGRGGRFGGRFGGSKRTQVIVWLFPRVGALDVYGANLRLYARGPGRTASFASLLFLILHHEKLT